MDEAYATAKEVAEQEYKLIRDMSIDNDQVMPNARTRHWMIAQSHLMMRDGLDKVFEENAIEQEEIK